MIRYLGEFLSSEDQETLAERASSLEDAFEARFGRFWSDLVSGNCRVSFLTRSGRSWNVDGPLWEKDAEEEEED